MILTHRFDCADFTLSWSEKCFRNDPAQERLFSLALAGRKRLTDVDCHSAMVRRAYG